MGSWEKICNKIDGLKPALIMVLVQTLLSIVNVGYKLASNDGMNLSILVGYRFMFGAAFILPIAFFAERKKRPKLTVKILFYGFLCGLFGGALGQNLYLKSLSLTSATFASAMTNLMPAMTFIVATCLRMERLQWSTAAGKAKVVGTLFGIGGAMLFTFYKGPELHLWDTGINLLEITSKHPQATHHTTGGHNLVVGLLLALGSCVCLSLWLIVQAKVAEIYPCPYSIAAMMIVWSSIQSVVFSLCTERNWSEWALGWNIRLLTVVVAGVFGSGLMVTLIAWCVRARGPLFVSIFNPLVLVMVAIAGFLFMEEKLHLGMVLGAVLIVIGLYVVLWGKGKEFKKASVPMPETEKQNDQVQIDMPKGPSSSLRKSSSRKKVGPDCEEERRDSYASSSDFLAGVCILP